MKSFQDLFPTATDGIMGLTQKAYWGPWRSTSRTADERPTLSVDHSFSKCSLGVSMQIGTPGS